MVSVEAKAWAMPAGRASSAKKVSSVASAAAHGVRQGLAILLAAGRPMRRHQKPEAKER